MACGAGFTFWAWEPAWGHGDMGTPTRGNITEFEDKPENLTYQHTHMHINVNSCVRLVVSQSTQSWVP